MAAPDAKASIMFGQAATLPYNAEELRMPANAQDTMPATERTMASVLSDIRSQEIIPAELATLVERVLPMLEAARAEAKVTIPPREAMASDEELFTGRPLLSCQDFPCDMGQALALFPKLIDLLAECGGEAALAAQGLHAALAVGEIDARAALNSRLREAPTRPPRALDFVATSALAPSLALAAEQLAKLLPKNMPYERGHCPLCGSQPYISLLRGSEGRRNAVCSFCAHEYRTRRIACAYCDEGDQERLRLFRVEAYPAVRVDVCDTCKTYIKTLDYREQDGSSIPSLDDLATVALDIMAQQQGYSRPVLYAWGF